MVCHNATLESAAVEKGDEAMRGKIRKLEVLEHAIATTNSRNPLHIASKLDLKSSSASKGPSVW